MNILAIRPSVQGGPAAAGTVATFDLVLTDDIKMFGLVLRRRPDGSFAAYPPKNRANCVSATFAPELAARVTAAAVGALHYSGNKGQTARDKSNAA